MEGKPAAISQLELSIGSFPEKIEKSKELDDFYNLRTTAKETIFNENGDVLKFVEGSADKTVVIDINESDGFSELIKNFNGLDKESVVGSKVSKKLVVEMLNIIKEPSFRETEAGKLIYKAYREFVVNFNIDILELNGLSYKKDILQNIVLYITLGCDVNILNLRGISRNIVNLLSCTNVMLNTSVIESARIDQIRNSSEIEIENNTDRASTDLDNIENSKKSYFNRSLGFLK